MVHFNNGRRSAAGLFLAFLFCSPAFCQTDYGSGGGANDKVNFTSFVVDDDNEVIDFGFEGVANLYQRYRVDIRYLRGGTWTTLNLNSVAESSAVWDNEQIVSGNQGRFWNNDYSFPAQNPVMSGQAAFPVGGFQDNDVVEFKVQTYYRDANGWTTTPQPGSGFTNPGGSVVWQATYHPPPAPANMTVSNASFSGSVLSFDFAFTNATGELDPQYQWYLIVDILSGNTPPDAMSGGTACDLSGLDFAVNAPLNRSPIAGGHTFTVTWPSGHVANGSGHVDLTIEPATMDMNLAYGAKGTIRLVDTASNLISDETEIFTWAGDSEDCCCGLFELSNTHFPNFQTELEAINDNTFASADYLEDMLALDITRNDRLLSMDDRLSDVVTLGTDRNEILNLILDRLETAEDNYNEEQETPGGPGGILAGPPAGYTPVLNGPSLPFTSGSQQFLRPRFDFTLPNGNVSSHYFDLAITDSVVASGGAFGFHMAEAQLAQSIFRVLLTGVVWVAAVMKCWRLVGGS